MFLIGWLKLGVMQWLVQCHTPGHYGRAKLMIKLLRLQWHYLICKQNAFNRKKKLTFIIFSLLKFQMVMDQTGFLCQSNSYLGSSFVLLKLENVLGSASGLVEHRLMGLISRIFDSAGHGQDQIICICDMFPLDATATRITLWKLLPQCKRTWTHLSPDLSIPCLISKMGVQEGSGDLQGVLQL